MPAPDEIRRRRDELAPWFHHIDLGGGISTTDAGHDHPAVLWQTIARQLPRKLKGRRVLDIGCNAGSMSFAAKRLGADYVLGIDANLGATTSFIEQAEFCRSVLGLDVEFREQSFFDLEPDRPFDLVLFCGVLYHLENFATALDRLLSFAVPSTGRIVLETAIESVTQTFPGGEAYYGDTTTFFVPSLGVLLELVRERGFRVDHVEHGDALQYSAQRALLFLRPPA